MTLFDFLPGTPLPATSADARKRQLYHAIRKDSQAVTMIFEGGSWQWRRLRGGEGADAYGAGGWTALQEWLRG